MNTFIQKSVLLYMEKIMELTYGIRMFILVFYSTVNELLTDMMQKHLHGLGKKLYH